MQNYFETFISCSVAHSGDMWIIDSFCCYIRMSICQEQHTKDGWVKEVSSRWLRTGRPPTRKRQVNYCIWYPLEWMEHWNSMCVCSCPWIWVMPRYPSAKYDNMVFTTGSRIRVIYRDVVDFRLRRWFISVCHSLFSLQTNLHTNRNFCKKSYLLLFLNNSMNCSPEWSSS